MSQQFYNACSLYLSEDNRLKNIFAKTRRNKRFQTKVCSLPGCNETFDNKGKPPSAFARQKYCSQECVHEALKV